MLFTCPGAAARGGARGAAGGKRRHFCVDIHCHVHHPAADEMVKQSTITFWRAYLLGDAKARSEIVATASAAGVSSAEADTK